MPEREKVKLIAQNRKAHHDYYVDETYEAGVELFGTEVKSLRQGAVSLRDSYCTVRRGELFAVGVRISPYEKGNIYNRDPLREKKLLMHKREILKLMSLCDRDGYTLVPISLYFKHSRVKMEIGVCRGKNTVDRRETIRRRDVERDTQREIAHHYR